MAPKKKVDKGKRPMVEPEVPQRVTRSRNAGIFITEPQEQRPVVEQAQTDRVPEVTARDSTIPRVEEIRVENDNLKEPRMEVGRPSAMVGSDPRMDVVIELLTQLVQAQTQQRTSFGPSPLIEARAQELVQEVAQPQVEENVTDRDFERRERPMDDRADMRAFQDLHPPAYKGETDFQVVEGWVAKLEKIFNYLKCSDEQRVRYATFMLEGEADQWWTTEMQTLPRQGGELTWAEFLRRFYAQFIPESERDHRAYEFAALVQGKMSVAEYDSQFRRLGRHVEWTFYLFILHG